MTGLNFEIVTDDGDSIATLNRISDAVENVGDEAKQTSDKGSKSFEQFAISAVSLNQSIELVKKGFSLLETAISGPIKAFNSLVQVSFAMVDAYDEHASAVAQLVQSMANQGAATGQNIKEWEQWAAAVEEATTVSQATVLKLASQAGAVVGFTEEMKTAVELAIDVAAAADRSVGEALGAITRATQSGSFELARFGVTVLKAEDELGRLKEILQITGAAFGGFAEAAANPIDRVRNDFRNLKIAIGETILATPEFTGFLDGLREEVKLVTDFIKSNSADAAAVFGTVFQGAFAAAELSVAGILTAFEAVTKVIQGALNVMESFGLVDLSTPLEIQLAQVTDALFAAEQAAGGMAREITKLGSTEVVGVFDDLKKSVDAIFGSGDFTKQGSLPGSTALKSLEEIDLDSVISNLETFQESLEAARDMMFAFQSVPGAQKFIEKMDGLDAAATLFIDLSKAIDIAGDSAANQKGRVQELMDLIKQGMPKLGDAAGRIGDSIRAGSADAAANAAGEAAMRAAEALGNFNVAAFGAADASGAAAPKIEALADALKEVKSVADQLDEAFQFGKVGDQRGKPPPLPPGAGSQEQFIGKAQDVGDAFKAIQLSDIIPTDLSVQISQMAAEIESAFGTMGDSAGGIEFIKGVLENIGSAMESVPGEEAAALFATLSDAVMSLTEPLDAAKAGLDAVKGAADAMPEEVKVKITAAVSAELAGGGGGGSSQGGGDAASALEGAAAEIEAGAAEGADAITNAGASVETAAAQLVGVAGDFTSAISLFTNASGQLSAAAAVIGNSGLAVRDAATTLSTVSTSSGAVLTSAGASLSGAAAELSAAARDFPTEVHCSCDNSGAAGGGGGGRGSSSSEGRAGAQGGGVDINVDASGLDIDVMVDAIERALADRGIFRRGFQA